nr:hypothetical protein VITISV_026523 [Ipomoea trifida]
MSPTSFLTQTKILKTGSGFGSVKNQIKLKLYSSSSFFSSLSLKNKTKLLKPNSDSSKVSQKNQFKKLNSTSNLLKLKASNSTKTTKKSSYLTKLSSSFSKNKTSNAAAQAKEQPKLQEPKSQSTKKISPCGTKPYWIDDEQDDLISEFKDIPLISFAFIFIPLILVSLISLFLPPKTPHFHPDLPRHLLLHSLPLLAGHQARAAQVFLRYVAIHLRGIEVVLEVEQI